MIAAKCSVNLFIYLVLKADFRQRVYEILGCLSVDDWQDKGRVLGDTARNGGGGRNNGVNNAGFVSYFCLNCCLGNLKVGFECRNNKPFWLKIGNSLKNPQKYLKL
ncbi:unnamed protein product [Meloidogyne enterolobii]|uniref:Uncharacterized protein n=1 Tax=Meloidogyne enterolobii TaxID=390850 RepID=A0ACB0ZST5_MELEN